MRHGGGKMKNMELFPCGIHVANFHQLKSRLRLIAVMREQRQNLLETGQTHMTTELPRIVNMNVMMIQMEVMMMARISLNPSILFF